MKLYFIRHGKTEWNLEGRFQGAGGDSPLLPTAIEELHILGKHLAKTRFDKIFSSDLSRAVRTAQIINSENHFPQEIILKEKKDFIFLNSCSKLLSNHLKIASL